MSITDELREWVRDGKGSLLAIADRIDAEHESACADAYGRGVMSVPIALDESAWVELPKDMDGVPIRVGDKVQLIGNDLSTVSHMSLADDGWRVYVKYDGRIGTGSGEPKRIRHHYVPTVVDVLREFAEKVIDSQIPSVHPTYEEAITEYAAKLRLAGDAE